MRKILCKAIVFCAIFAIIWCTASVLLRGKWLGKDVTGTLNTYEQLQADTIDVLFVGSSNIFASINPMIMWQQSGITSFVLASPLQQVPASAYLLEKALKTQTPQLVCFEVRSTVYSPRTDEDKIHQLVDGEPFSFSKLKAVQTMKHDSDSMVYLMSPLLRFHTRWKSLTRADFEYLAGDTVQGYNTNGYYSLYNKKSIPLNSYYENVENAQIHEENIAALDKMVALCREKGIEIVFVKTPTEEWREAYSDLVQEYADENNIPFLDTNLLMDEIGLDKKEDFNDFSHFNVWGAEKFTAYFTDYLQTNYTLNDRRTQSEIANEWNDNYNKYVRTTITHQNDIEEWFSYVNDENLVVILGTQNIGLPVNEKAKAVLEANGLKSIADIKTERACIAIFDGGELSYVSVENPKECYTFKADNLNMTIDVSRSTVKTKVKIDYDTVFATVNDGLAAVVYDKQTKEIIDKVVFTIYEEECDVIRAR